MRKRVTPEAAIAARMSHAADPDEVKRRFMKYVVIDARSGCWLWQGGKAPKDYGRFFFQGETRLAHRAAYLIFVGPLTDGQIVLHQCDNKLCVNPAHLRPGTHEDNMREAVERGRMWAHNKILTDEQVIEIRRTFKGIDGEHRVLAAKYGVAHSTIANIIRGHTYKNLPMFPEAEPLPNTPTLSTKRRQGEAHHKAKLTAEDVRAMRAESAEGAKGVDLAKKYGIQKAQVSAILSGRYWKNA